MVTDPPPLGPAARLEYAASEVRETLPLPPGELVRGLAAPVMASLAGGRTGPVKVAGAALLDALSAFYRIGPPSLRVLGVRPHEVEGGVCVFQLFGDYAPATSQIRVFMRTAIKGQIVRPKSFLCTLLHEFCHHLDVRLFGWRSSYHTRGFFGRIDGLYHLALGTPEAARRPLHWVPAGEAWRIDWPAMRAPRPGGPEGQVPLAYAAGGGGPKPE
ncbi:MAG TPA: hypothetical protein VFS43_22280 [Polyangiaceae bacterium]|nr:hypothetical protein [Polyangiaceae bacterium]